jgi:hypothetical protein
MRRRKWLAALVVGIVALLAGAAAVLWPPSIAPGRTQDNFDRIRPGMTRSTVEAILGPPEYVQGGGIRFPPLPTKETTFWNVDGIVVHVSFDNSGTVNDKSPQQFKVRSHGQLDEILQRLKSQLREWFP